MKKEDRYIFIDIVSKYHGENFLTVIFPKSNELHGMACQETYAGMLNQRIQRTRFRRVAGVIR